MSAPRRCEHARRHGRQLRVDLRQDAWARLEQLETDLVTTDARIEPQHVVGERRQLADQLDADEASADHDDRETAGPRAAESDAASASSSCSIR